ncbi:MAG TPA: hypothetical protein VFW28_02575 [Micropepsaceae bacterium]|nr:hypothetical protein [Micropepsaceae bacterium]
MIANALYRIADFLNLLEDDRPRLSLTKIGLWGATLTNLANAMAQVGDQVRALLTDTPGHPSLPLLAATSLTHAIAAAKAEIKRRSERK